MRNRRLAGKRANIAATRGALGTIPASQTRPWKSAQQSVAARTDVVEAVSVKPPRLKKVKRAVSKTEAKEIRDNRESLNGKLKKELVDIYEIHTGGPPPSKMTKAKMIEIILAEQSMMRS